MHSEIQSKDQEKFVFFQPKTLSLFSQLANISAWINLVIVILYLIFEFFYLDRQIMETSSLTSFFDAGIDGHWWEWKNITSDVVIKNVFSVVITTVALAGNFFLFKSVSIGLNVLLELGFTMMPDDEEADNE